MHIQLSQREEGGSYGVGRPEGRVERRPLGVPVLAGGRVVGHGRVREGGAVPLEAVEEAEALGGAGLWGRSDGRAADDELPPPVLGALVAAPAEVDVVGVAVGLVGRAVAPRAEPGLRGHVEVDVLELAGPVGDGVEGLVFQGEVVLREALVREAGAHGLPGGLGEAHAPAPPLAGPLPHGPGVGAAVLAGLAEDALGQRSRRVRVPAEVVDALLVADGAAAAGPVEVRGEGVPAFLAREGDHEGREHGRAGRLPGQGTGEIFPTF